MCIYLSISYSVRVNRCACVWVLFGRCGILQGNAKPWPSLLGPCRADTPSPSPIWSPTDRDRSNHSNPRSHHADRPHHICHPIQFNPPLDPFAIRNAPLAPLYNPRLPTAPPFQHTQRRARNPRYGSNNTDTHAQRHAPACWSTWCCPWFVPLSVFSVETLVVSGKSCRVCVCVCGRGPTCPLMLLFRPAGDNDPRPRQRTTRTTTAKNVGYIRKAASCLCEGMVCRVRLVQSAALNMPSARGKGPRRGLGLSSALITPPRRLLRFFCSLSPLAARSRAGEQRFGAVGWWILWLCQ